MPAGLFPLRLWAWLRDGRLLPTPSHDLSWGPVWAQFFSSYKDTNQTGLGPTFMTTFSVNSLFKDTISKYSLLRY